MLESLLFICMFIFKRVLCIPVYTLRKFIRIKHVIALQ